MRSILGFGWRVLVWFALLGLLAVLAAAVLVPRLAGATPYSVLSGSMTPTLSVGTLVVSRPVDPTELGAGSVITYQTASGQDTVVTHRVTQQGTNQSGEPIFRTQGDANDVPDQDWVRAVQVRGEMWYSLPYLGYVNRWLTGDQRQWAIYAVAGVLLGYAAVMFVGAARERRERMRDEPAELASTPGPGQKVGER